VTKSRLIITRSVWLLSRRKHVAKILAQLPPISVGAIELVSIDFGPWLDSGETLSGTPSAAEQTTSDLTIASVAVNSTALTILGNSVPAGEAVTFKVSGQKVNVTYRVLVTADTTAGRREVVEIRFTAV